MCLPGYTLRNTRAEIQLKQYWLMSAPITSMKGQIQTVETKEGQVSANHGLQVCDMVVQSQQLSEVDTAVHLQQVTHQLACLLQVTQVSVLSMTDPQQVTKVSAVDTTAHLWQATKVSAAVQLQLQCMSEGMSYSVGCLRTYNPQCFQQLPVQDHISMLLQLEQNLIVSTILAFS